MRFTEKQFIKYKQQRGLILCKHQPFNDYRDWYKDSNNNLYIFYLDCQGDETEYELLEIKKNHIDEPKNGVGFNALFNPNVTEWKPENPKDN